MRLHTLQTLAAGAPGRVQATPYQAKCPIKEAAELLAGEGRKDPWEQAMQP